MRYASYRRLTDRASKRSICRRAIACLVAMTLLACAASSVSASPATTQAAGVERIDVFNARANGYSTCRIPGIVVTKAGTLLAYCEGRKTAKGDWGPIDLLMRRSVDG